MKSNAFLILALFLAAACTPEERFEYSGDLQVGVPQEGELEVNTPHTYTLSLNQNAYIYGVVNQISGDVFFIGQVEFARDKAGRVTSFDVSNGRTRGIRFDRL